MRSFTWGTLLTILVGCQLVAQPRKAPYNPSRKLTVEQLQGDFRLMRAALEELHPSLYWYTPRDTMKRVFDQTYASLTQPLTEQEFINRLYPAICQIRCGHTQLVHSAAYRESPNRPRRVHLPFDVFVQGNRAWLLNSSSVDSTLVAGAELVSINGVPIENIIRVGLSLWSSDGFNVSWKEFFLNEYDFFEDACWAVYGWKGPYSLQVRMANGSERTLTVAPKSVPAPLPKPIRPARKLSMAEEKTLARQKEEEHKRSYLNLRLLDSSTAVLMVNGLEYGDEEFYRQAFQELAQKPIKNLILDVRRNHGGDARIINDLLSYLADSSYVFLRKAMTRAAHPASNRFVRQFDPGITRGFEATYKLSHLVGEWYEFDFREGMNRLMTYQPVKPARFSGKLYVLIDGGTFSNAANFVAALRAARPQTVFVGRETGGAESGCGGSTNRLTLPNSQIVVQFPWMRLVSVSKNAVEGHGVLPDYPVAYTPEAILSHRDLDLEKALTLIQEGSNSTAPNMYLRR